MSPKHSEEVPGRLDLTNYFEPLVHASADVDPGAYFLLDANTKQMSPVIESNKFIDPSMLAPMKAVSVQIGMNMIIVGSKDADRGTPKAES